MQRRRLLGLPALSDDSGITIDALDGAPGVYTADWAETSQGRDFMLAMTRANDEITAKGPDAPAAPNFVAHWFWPGPMAMTRCLRV